MPLAGAHGACAHCTLQVPAGLIVPDAALQFCCRGCGTAHALIHSQGLEAYYALPERGGDQVATGDRKIRYAELDRPAFIDKHTTKLDHGQRSATLGIEGIHCAACLWLLERLPRVVPGVIESRVNWRRATISVRWSDNTVTLAAIAEGIAALGYRPHPLRVDSRAAWRKVEDRKRLIGIAVAFAAAGNNMLIAGSLYLGLFSYMDADITQLLRWGSCLVGMVSLAWPGRVFFRGAWSALRSRTPHMDLPVALGLAVGGLAGLFNTIRGTGELYFDTLSVLVFLLLVGRALQLRQQRFAASALDVLYRVTPRMAHKLVDGGFHEVPAEVLEVGDIVAVAATQTIPGDGVVVAGRSNIDQQVLTGESQPVAVAPGSAVAAGTVNLGARLQVRIETVGEDTRMGRVLGLVEQSAESRPPIVALADRIGGWFVVTVLGLAAITLGAWLVVQPTAAVDHAVSLLIVACPCALALATPLAVSVAIGRAAQRKILIKGGDVLQRLATPGTVWLDKTGTLTEGRLTVVAVRGETGVGETGVAAAVGALESHSAHPVAKALCAWASDIRQDAPGNGHAALPRATNVEQSALGGISGYVDGRHVVIGTERYVGSQRLDPETMKSDAVALLAESASPVFVAIDGKIAAAFGVDDPLRSDAAAVVSQLHERGWSVGILSGDHPAIVARVGKALGLPAARCHGGLTPADKVQYVAGTSCAAAADARPHTVVMVGDGVNDSAALAAASVGIAAHHGAQASLQAAPVYLARPGLGGLIDLLDTSVATMRGIRRNFVVSLGYNALAVGLAAFGLIGPLLAALLMPLSSLSVVALSLAAPRPQRRARTARTQQQHARGALA